MARYVVELFGLPNEITDLRKIEISLKDKPKLVDVISVLRREIPALEGQVIRSGENRLVEHCAFNINGHFYSGDHEVQLQEDDQIALLTLATGG
ncbi:MAG: MoaD/ThiS family protein [Dehalococcoidales bacterium]|nr:MoaD/ThiS family protein [Dehalococcoidales bacterium]